MLLPSALRSTIDAMLEGRSRRSLANHAQATSAGYRAGLASAATVRTDDEVVAYLVTRFPATYAAIGAALGEAAAIVPAFSPARILDIACGPGTATFAAAEIWPSLVHATLVDCNPALLAAARVLADAYTLARTHPRLTPRYFDVVQARAEAIAADLTMSDLVVVGYGLVEMAPQAARALIGALWQRCSGFMVLVEPGSTSGFARIRDARDLLLRHGGHLVAPCPHEAACPMPSGDWCHFVQRLPRSRDHLMAKEARVPFEDEKYAYVAVAREAPKHRPIGRVLRPPRVSKALWIGEVCTHGAIETRRVDCRQPEFKALRKLGWGDSIFATLPATEADPGA